jgi:phenylacetic acid degradation operon negative regulatory protein
MSSANLDAKGKPRRSTASIDDAVAAALGRFHARTPIRTGSLIVTIFGDAIAARGGTLSLASLLLITAAFRIDDGPVRTALSRLVADGWFERRKVGRNSFYRLTRHGHETFGNAALRIYAGQAAPWDGTLHVHLRDAVGARAKGRMDIKDAGFGVVSAELWISPHAATAPERGALRLTANSVDPDALRDLGRLAWPLDALAERYAAFIADYGPVARLARPHGDDDALQALVLRLLLIHDYRRIILRDPLLPAALLPSPWPGDAARTLCGRAYRSLLGGSERWLDTTAACEAGPLPAATGDLRRRFVEDGA